MTRRPRSRRRSVPEGLTQAPRCVPKLPFSPVALLLEDQVEQIHAASLTLLHEHGIEMLSARARDILEAAGAAVDRTSNLVRFDPALVLDLVAKAPETFTLHARNPAHDLPIGGGRMVFTSVSSAPNATDLAGGRRQGCFRDFEDLVRLSQTLNAVHALGGYPVEPTDLPPDTRHLDCIRSILTLTDKVPRVFALGAARIRDGLAMTRIAHGLDSEDKRPVLYTVVNANSPMRYDGAMLEGLIAMAGEGQPVIVTPFTLAGAMAPITIEGALAQQNAEALAGIALTQAVNPGVPVFYGSFTSSVDMKTGAPAFGTPEYVRASIASGQVARRYGLPLRVTNANASNAADAQAVYESQMSLWAAVLSGAALVHHAAGWLEGGLAASFEKMIIDAEMIQMLIAVLQPFQFDDLDGAMRAVRAVGPGGHFFGSPFTMQRYETAFYQPMLSDWRNFETWQEAGAKDATTRAAGLVRRALEAYQAPPFLADRAETLDAYVARRRAEIERDGL